MIRSRPPQPDPRLDLVLERVVDVPKELVWKAWTEAEHLKKWFTPAPWSTTDCEIDLRPGGIFRTVMRSPEGEEIDGGAGCFLEIIEHEKLVWTSALGPGFRPVRQQAQTNGKDCGELLFTAVIMLEQAGNGTRYTAIAVHPDPASRERHAKMGFHEGWGQALDQLVAVAETL